MGLSSDLKRKWYSRVCCVKGSEKWVVWWQVGANSTLSEKPKGSSWMMCQRDLEEFEAVEEMQ